MTCEPLSVRTFGKTQGFWDNTNGQALIPANFTYTLGVTSRALTCYLLGHEEPDEEHADHPARTGRGTVLEPPCMKLLPSPLTSGIQNGSDEHVAVTGVGVEATTSTYISGFNGQTVGSMGLTSSPPDRVPDRTVADREQARFSRSSTTRTT